MASQCSGPSAASPVLRRRVAGGLAARNGCCLVRQPSWVLLGVGEHTEVGVQRGALQETEGGPA